MMIVLFNLLGCVLAAQQIVLKSSFGELGCSGAVQHVVSTLENSCTAACAGFPSANPTWSQGTTCLGSPGNILPGNFFGAIQYSNSSCDASVQTGYYGYRTNVCIDQSVATANYVLYNCTRTGRKDKKKKKKKQSS